MNKIRESTTVVKHSYGTIYLLYCEEQEAAVPENGEGGGREDRCITGTKLFDSSTSLSSSITAWLLTHIIIRWLHVVGGAKHGTDMSKQEGGEKKAEN